MTRTGNIGTFPNRALGVYINGNNTGADQVVLINYKMSTSMLTFATN
jgi:hypothetical protein